MHCRTGMSRKEISHELWESTARCINGNGVLMIIALARHTGWGKKRMTDFLKTYNDVQAEYHKYELEGVFDHCAEKEMAAIGLNMHEILPKPIDFMQHRRNAKKEQEKMKAPVSKSKAEELRRELERFGRYTDSLRTAASRVKGGYEHREG